MVCEWDNDEIDDSCDNLKTIQEGHSITPNFIQDARFDQPEARLPWDHQVGIMIIINNNTMIIININIIVSSPPSVLSSQQSPSGMWRAKWNFYLTLQDGLLLCCQSRSSKYFFLKYDHFYWSLLLSLYYVIIYFWLDPLLPSWYHSYR